MGGPEVRIDPADAERRVTRRDVCLACDQCIKGPAKPLACALIVNPDRDFEPCAAKLARMQAHPHAQCPHPDPAQRAKWAAAELNILGQPTNASLSGRKRQAAQVLAKRTGPAVTSGVPSEANSVTTMLDVVRKSVPRANHRDTRLTGATPIYARRAKRGSRAWRPYRFAPCGH